MDKVEAKVGYSIKKNFKVSLFYRVFELLTFLSLTDWNASIWFVFIFVSQEETLYMDRESQIKAIEKTFEDNKKPIEKHYSKPNVVPVEVLPIYPDFKVIL